MIPRDECLARLFRTSWDLVVIGGGITGAGIALDAASRGLKVALLEKRDFVSGTSSKSSKLIHGGLRYLKQFQFKTTLDSSREKTLLTRLAPHLIQQTSFLLPVFQGLPQWIAYSTGLWIYDAAAKFPRGLVHRTLSARETLRRIPRLRPDTLSCALLYFDGRADDCRLTLHVLKAAARQGALLVNNAEVVGFEQEQGRATAVRLREGSVRARAIVNATGVWAEEVASKNGSSPVRVRPSKGIHLVFPRRLLNHDDAAMLPSPDGRVIFLIPWGAYTLVGTTDTDYTDSLDSPSADADDVEFLLGALNLHLTGARVTRADIVSTYAGLRPLIHEEGRSTAATPRDHAIVTSPSGIVTTTGGKLTTYRLMAEETVDVAVPDAAPSRTRSIPLFALDVTQERIEREARAYELSFATIEHLMRAYGTEYRMILRLVGKDPSLGRPLLEGFPHILAEVDYAIEHEFAGAIADVLARRTRLTLFAGRAVASCVRYVAERMASKLNWDEKEIRRQLGAFEREAAHFQSGLS